MRTQHLIAFLAFTITVAMASPAYADSKWQGTSTNTSGNFKYGKVTFTMKGNTIKNFIIEGVTTIGSGGYKSVIVPKIKVSGNKFLTNYTPVPGINDVVVVSGKFSGNKVSGTFSEGPLCSNAGKFTAKRK